MRYFFILLAGLWAGLVRADEQIAVCYNYGCGAQADVLFTDARLRSIVAPLRGATSAAEERQILARVIGDLYAWAGEQSPVHADRGGNYADAGVSGRMDCIDHSTTTDRFLRMLEQRGWLNWHRVVAKERRVRVILFQHFSAVIEELPEPRSGLLLPRVPDYVPVMLAACDCQDVVNDIPRRAVSGEAGARFVVDSWFVDNGKPAAILPLDEWMDGGGPDVE